MNLRDYVLSEKAKLDEKEAELNRKKAEELALYTSQLRLHVQDALGPDLSEKLFEYPFRESAVKGEPGGASYVVCFSLMVYEAEPDTTLIIKCVPNPFNSTFEYKVTTSHHGFNAHYPTKMVSMDVNHRSLTELVICALARIF